MKNLLTIIILFINILVYAQSNIKSSMIFNPKTNDQTAVIKMGEYLIFSFDELNKGFKNYNYTVYHLDRNWKRSDLFQSEYINGYFNDQITSRKSSFNTLQSYTHYEFQFPNNSIRPKYSGNYEIIVYEKSENEPLINFRFSIYESLTNINILPQRNIGDGFLTQNLKISAITSGLNINQVINSLELKVMQNNNPNQVINKIKPQFINGNILNFNPLDLKFEGGSEFYFFDTKDSKIQGASTQSIKENTFYEHTLYFNEPNQDEYIFNQDVNGAYYFRKFDLGTQRNAINEADYVWVLFGLKSEKLENKDVYVIGAFNNYKLSEENKMIYKYEGFYELPLFLKQGYYNYLFATKDSNGKISLSDLNGSFWQTENLYQAYLYIKPWGLNYDALIGYNEYRLAR